MWEVLNTVRMTVGFAFATLLLFSCARNNPDVTNEGVSVATPTGQSSEDVNVREGGDSTMGSINSGTTNQRSALGTTTTGDTSRGNNTISGGNKVSGTTANTSNSYQGTSTQLRETTNANVIRDAQTQLSRKGYAVTVNGVLEPKTTDAIRNFQRDNNLQATGQLDKATLNALQVNTTEEDTRAPASVHEPIN